MKNAYLRALTISVMIAFAPLALASAQTDISVSDHSWIKGQQDALTAMKEDLQGHPAAAPVLPQQQLDLINRLQGDIAARTNTMGEKDTFPAIYFVSLGNPACTLSSHSCTTTESGICTHQSETYQCQKTWSSSGLVCGGEYICQSGACDETNGTGDNGFDTAVAKLAGLASAAEDVRDQNSTIDVRAFTGKAMSCRKAFAGFSNCCKDSGWGQDTGLAACNDDELALGKAKAKKITVSVGDRCDRQVLGACIQKSQVYCVFDGKLARIIQEQGRRDQLGVKFGSGDSPDCRGITVPELQSIDFDKINFSDFYEDLMKNQKIPDTSTQVQQIKERIAAQVNQQGGGK